MNEEQTVKDFMVGEKVQVHAFGRFYPGRVMKVGKTRVYVTYTTGSGATRTKAVTPGPDRFGGYMVKK